VAGAVVISMTMIVTMSVVALVMALAAWVLAMPSIVVAIPAVTMAVILGAAMKVVIRMPAPALSPAGQRAPVAIAWVVVVIYISMEVARTMKPRSGSNENAAVEPCGAIVTVRSAVVGGVGKISIGADRLRPDIQ